MFPPSKPCRMIHRSLMSFLWMSYANNNKNKKNKAKHAVGGNAGDGSGGHGGNNKGPNGSGGGNNKDPYKMIEHGNYKLEAFYAYQGLHDYRWDGLAMEQQSEPDPSGEKPPNPPRLVPCSSDSERHEERQKWLTSIKTTLPAAFRIGQDVPVGLRLKLEEELHKYVGTKLDVEITPRGGQQLIDKFNLQTETKRIEPVRSLDFIPHGYQLSVDKATIKRTPRLKEFHNWLTVQTEAGFITRQETVSMIPPVVLNPQPSDMILDMAAAPGSKTSQLLEVVNLPASPRDIEPTGCVVANDSDVKRAYMLVRQVRRINTPALFITSCDARFFPLLKDPSKHSSGQDEGIFDRVLADVPCSGDGTSRKNPGIWKQFTPLNGYALHPLQLQIALRGAQSTKVGGYLCYSTCSMNPIENEAVVAELIRASDGALELVDRSSEMPELLSRPGMTFWHNIAESKTNRQLKNEFKKNNPKMQAKRQQWNNNVENQDKKDQELDEGQGEEQDPKAENADPAAAAAAGTAEEKEPSATTAVSSGDQQPDSMVGEMEDAAAATTTAATDQPATTDEPNSEDSGYRGIKTPFVPATMGKDELKKLCEVAGMTQYDTYEDVPEALRKRIRPTCFPPTPEEVTKMNLQYCMRILPHDMDTGGFFVALLKKVAPLNPRAKKRFESLQEQEQDVAGDNKKNKAKEGRRGRTEKDDEPAVKKPRIDPPPPSSATATNEKNDVAMANDNAGDSGSVKEELNEKDDKASGDNKDVSEKDPPSKGGRDKKNKNNQKGDKDNFIPAPDDVIAPLKDYYGLDDESFKAGQYMIRAKGDAKVLYFMTKTVKTKLIDHGLQDKVTTITSGVKGFIRNSKESDVAYRLSQEGVHFVAPHMSKRKVTVDLDDFEKCLSASTVKIEEFKSELFREQIRALAVGCFVIQLKGYENNYLEKFVICMWRCRSDTLNTLVSSTDIDGLKSKIRSIRPTTEEEKGSVE
mmetsp:Transcript_6022/g.14942  ORF Transcript_6022/g.14942 Transcript_6022/m.14942 type:complete len:976 (-) Transcript_6022:3803-6730(-)